MKKIVSTLLIGILIFSNIAVIPVRAANEAESAPEADPVGTVQPSPSPEDSPTPSPEISASPSPSPLSDSTDSTAGEAEGAGEATDTEGRVSRRDDDEENEPEYDWQAARAQALATYTPQQGDTTGSQNQDGGMGDTSIDTGNALATADINNFANLNLGTGGTGAEDINVGNTGNGDGSTNSADVINTNNSDVLQNNYATVNNTLDMGAISGQNSASGNTAGDVTITTGEAYTTATVINGVNTNVDGVAMIEFNIDDTHTGDVILAFPETTGCIATVCGTNGDLTAQNSQNGENSTNNAAITTTNTDETFQNNTADVVNDLTLVADSGHNDANSNTGGNTSITTQDASVTATVGNFINNNIAGAEVLIAVVNVLADFVGDIILPESTLALSGGGSTTVANTGNGQDSTNTAGVTSTNNYTTTQNNTAIIDNNLDIAATTGGNNMDGNTAGFENGGNTLTTGEATVDVNVVNIANTNILDGASWWLVFVNEAGNWVGRILGAPEGANMAGSTGTEFVMLADGSIVVKNTGNGEGSTNDANVDTTNNTNITQTNTASVTNNINLIANTGGNSANGNTGGVNSITTGNASVVANLTNFVNNNFIGGKVVVTFVNVFKTWTGDFITPGNEKEENTAIGGTDTGAQNQQSNNYSNNSQSNSSSNSQAAANNTASAGTVKGISQTLDSGLAFLGFGGGNQANSNTTVDPSQNIEEDNTISVPQTKTAGVKTSVPSWFWNLFAVALSLVVIKKFYRMVVTSPAKHL